MKLKSPKVTKKTVEQEIDLMDAFGVNATDVPALKEALAQKIIDRMVERTEGGRGIKFSRGGNASEVKLKSPYSKEYQKSLPFIAAGKKANDVNMTLTGDMLASVDVISTSGNKIKIGITDELQILKAFNHITGDTVPERPWFGVSKEELEKIGQDFADEIEAIKVRDLTSPRQQQLLDLLDTIRGSDGAGLLGSED